VPTGWLGSTWISWSSSTRSASAGILWAWRYCRSQALAEHVPEQLVISIPPSLAIERNQEEIGSLQRLQDCLPILPARERVAQRAAQALENRGLEQKRLDVRDLLVENLFDEVVDDISIDSCGQLR
jgi:hypothetical protein